MTLVPLRQSDVATPHVVMDEFLCSEASTLLLDKIIAAKPLFVPTTIVVGENERINSSVRSSMHLPNLADLDISPLLDAVRSNFVEICQSVGVQPFPLHRLEASVVAHGDGDFYARHTDVRHGGATDIRMISCIYYLHRQPAVFSGGELALHSVFANGPTAKIAARHNRLVAFPSFYPHEVLPIGSTGRFEESRFSVNCWLRRLVRPKATSGEKA